MKCRTVSDPFGVSQGRTGGGASAPTRRKAFRAEGEMRLGVDTAIGDDDELLLLAGLHMDIDGEALFAVDDGIAVETGEDVLPLGWEISVRRGGKSLL